MSGTIAADRLKGLIDRYWSTRKWYRTKTYNTFIDYHLVISQQSTISDGCGSHLWWIGLQVLVTWRRQMLKGTSCSNSSCSWDTYVSQYRHDRRHRSLSDSPPPWAVSLESRQDITHTTFDCSLVPLFLSSCGPSRPVKLTTPAVWGAGGSMTGWSEAYYN
jgi:hypothetical protein